MAPIHSLIHLLPKKHDPNVNLQHDITLNAYNGTITDKCCSTQWHGLLEFDVPTTKGLFTKGLQIDEALICSGPQTTKNPWFRLLIIQMSVESQILCFWVSQGVTLVPPNPTYEFLSTPTHNLNGKLTELTEGTTGTTHFHPYIPDKSR